MNSIRSWALVVGVVVGGLLGANCGPPKQMCTSTSCTGCCDSKTGACVSLTTSQACGRSGETCKQCSLAESCSFGTCMVTTSGSGGGVSSGGGFATGGGTSGGFSTGGGNAGGSSGGGSAGGATGGGTGSCGPANCAGCCASGTCRNFPNNAAASSCGSNGQACVACQTGQTCSQTSFTCQGGPPVGGGSATGGGTAGPTYSQQTINAACEPMTSATPLLSSSTPTPISDDVTTMPFIIPTFGSFFGTPVSYASVQSNGMVQLHTSSSGLTSNDYMNTSIPTAAAPNGFAAAYWTDLCMSLTPLSSVNVLTVASPAHYTINWLEPLGAGTEVQAKFFQTGVIEFHYCNLPSSAPSATVGLESLDGTRGVSWTGTPMTGSGVRFTPTP